MNRLSMLLFAALFVLAPVAVHAEAAGNWTKIASVEIDPRTSGVKVIDLPQTVSAYRELRFVANKLIAIGKVRTSDGGAMRVADGNYTAKPGQPSASFYTTKDPSRLKSVEIVWTADAAATGPVTLEVWALPAASDFVAKSTGGGTRGIGGPEAGAPVPPSAPAPATRSITSAKPAIEPATPGSAGASADKPALPPVVDSAGGGKPNACADDKVCTIVDVFFGTDRNQLNDKDRINFGSTRKGAMTLGHAFVTVPKASRDKGAIPLPSLWDKYIRGVPPEGDPARHFTIPKQGVTVYSTEDEFVAAAKKHIATAGDFKDHAFIFVHGFYVNFDNALYRTAQISYDLSPDGRPFGTAFLYSWPSAGDPTAYVFDQDSSAFSAPFLQAFLRTVIDKTGVKNVHIIAHSMGNVALIGALQELARNETKAKVNQIILAAPDYDKAQFETVITGVEKVAKGITLYASKDDRALLLARTARKGLPRAGEIMPPGPVVVKGIDTIDVTALSTAAFWGHDTYADSKEILADIATIFIKGDGPEKRSAKLKLLELGTLKYWKYGG